MLKVMKESMKAWLVEHERLYWYIVIGIAVFLFGLITAIGCGKLEKAEAAIAFTDENESDMRTYFYEKYNYYFVLESTPSQGKKWVFSTVPFTCYSDFVPEANGEYTMNLQAHGGDVLIVHGAYQNLEEYEQTFIACDNTAFLRFKYTGQEYHTNCSFGNGLFDSTPDLVNNCFFKCISYLKAQNVIFENYPFYMFAIGGSSGKLTYKFYLSADCNKPFDSNYYMCVYTPYDNKMELSTGTAFSVLNSSWSVPGTYNFKQDFGKLYTYTYRYNKHMVMYASSKRSLSGGGNYFESREVLHPLYEQYTGIAKPTPTPEPTPTPTPKKSVYDNTKPCFDGVTLRQDENNDGMKFWRVSYNTVPLKSTSIYSIARIGLPSKEWLVKNIVEGDSAEYVKQSMIDSWRMSGKDVVYIDYVQEDGEGVAGFTYASRLKEHILSHWSEIYGDVAESYISEIMRYSYVGCIAFRSQTENTNGDVIVGATTITYPIKFYMSYSDYYEDIEKLDGYSETVLYADTYGKTLEQIADMAAKKTDGEIADLEDEIKESDKVIEDLKQEIEKLEQEIESVHNGGIWGTFKSLADGLSSATDSFKKIASSVGDVFGFLPMEVTIGIGFIFVALIALAVYHAIRG